MLRRIVAERVIGLKRFIRPTDSREFEQQAGKLLNVVDKEPTQKGRNPVPRYTERKGEKNPKEGREIPRRYRCYSKYRSCDTTTGEALNISILGYRLSSTNKKGRLIKPD